MVDVAAGSALGRSERKKRTRDTVILTALRLVSERGLDHVTVDDVSEAAGVSARTFFNYFASKDDALFGDPAIDSDDVCARMRAMGPEVALLDVLRMALRPSIERLQEESELWFLRMRMICKNPSMMPRLLARDSVAEDAIVDAVAIRMGADTESGFPRLFTAVVGAAFRTALIQWASCAGARPLGEFVDEALDSVASGLAEPAHLAP